MIDERSDPDVRRRAQAHRALYACMYVCMYACMYVFMCCYVTSILKSHAKISNFNFGFRRFRCYHTATLSSCQSASPLPLTPPHLARRFRQQSLPLICDQQAHSCVVLFVGRTALPFIPSCRRQEFDRTFAHPRPAEAARVGPWRRQGARRIPPPITTSVYHNPLRAGGGAKAWFSEVS